MTNEEKIDLINTLPVIDFDCDGEICNLVLVPVGSKTREILKELGYDDDYIDANVEDGKIDISSIGFSFSDWWDTDRGFTFEEGTHE